MYKTRNMCLISAIYSFVKHTDHSPCMLKHEETISLEQNDVFPPASACGNPAFWVLCREDDNQV